MFVRTVNVMLVVQDGEAVDVGHPTEVTVCVVV